jgi:zinc D-Ala-D-Ala dipeptidase
VINKYVINEKEVSNIPISENNEPLIDLKEQNEISYGPPPDTPLTKNDYTKIRKTVYEKLCQAQNRLPNNWKFRIYEGLRSLNVQKILFESLYNSLKLKKLDQSEEELFEQTSLLIAPVKFYNGAINIPPHSTGGAVDLEVIDKDGNLVNFGMEIKDWNQVTPNICETFSQDISEDAIKNRKILLDIMHEQDFVNYPQEWWHFSYGDRLWAYLMDKKEAFYGGIAIANPETLI